MKLSGEDLSRYSNKIESTGFKKCSYYHCPPRRGRKTADKDMVMV